MRLACFSKLQDRTDFRPAGGHDKALSHVYRITRLITVRAEGQHAEAVAVQRAIHI
jgi:hypothetical protein